MKRCSLLIFISLFLFTTAPVFSQPFTVKLMCWNLLNYPDQANVSGDTALRNPFYRSVVQYEDPDILVTEENTTSTPTNMFLDNVMNANGAVYGKGSFINGWDTNNEIFFKNSLFTFLSYTRIRTDVRDINGFKLVHTITGDTILIFAVHLKASSGSPNDAQRAQEVDSLRKFTNQLPAGSNFIVCGDFNLYGDYESAYQKLLQDNANDDGNFIDPISMTGVWNRYLYRYNHTQSTRTASFGGGSTGGLDDRFDMILFSTAISQGTHNIYYTPGSTTPVGNDGNHYGQALNSIPNSAAPANVINALYNASDHLPVTALLSIANPNGITDLPLKDNFLSVHPNPFNRNAMLKFRIEKPAEVRIKVMDVLGNCIAVLLNEHKATGEYDLPITLPDGLAKGIYFIQLQEDNTFISTKFISY